MNLTVLRLSTENDYTIGALYEEMRSFVDQKQRKLLSFTVEDEHRNEKVYGETRIPAGKYKIELREHGGFYERYTSRFDWHEGMLEITGVPNFTDVLIHIGNTEEDTAGCLLISHSINITGFGGNSINQYKEVYLHILDKLKNGENVWIEYLNYDFM